MADTNLPQQGGPESIDEGRRLFTLGGAAAVVSATVAGVSGVARELIGVTPANAQEVQVASLDVDYIKLVQDNRREMVQADVAQFKDFPKRMDIFREAVRIVSQSSANEKSKSRAISGIAGFLASPKPSEETLSNVINYVPELKDAFKTVFLRNNPFFVAGVDAPDGAEFIFSYFMTKSVLG